MQFIGVFGETMKKVILGILTCVCLMSVLFVFGCNSTGEPENPSPTPPQTSTNEVYIYKYNYDLQGYILTGVSDSFDEVNVIIPDEYNDGIHGNKNVVAVQSGVFNGRDKIKKVIFPSTVTKMVKDESLEDKQQGFLFNGCSSLEYVKADGLITYVGSYNFRDCYSLKKYVINPKALISTSNFYTENGYARCVDLFVWGETFDSSFKLIDNDWRPNNLITGKYYFYDEHERCSTWKYDEDNVPQLSRSHEYENDVCVNCDAIDPRGIDYYFDEALEGYVMKGVPATFTGTIIKPTAYYDDGIHSYKPIVAVKTLAFSYRHTIKQIILPQTVKYVVGEGGDIFESCSSLEYVCLGGITSLFNVDGNKTINNFLNCVNLTKIVISPEYNGRNDHQQYYVNLPDYVAKLDVYVEGSKSDLSVNFGIGTEATYGYNNNMLTDTIYYFSETYVKGCWYYKDGVPTLWE